MRLLLVRHGQTDFNVQKKLQGSSEIPLNARGREQASLTHEFVKQQGLLPTKVITSPLGRAIETGAIVAGMDLSKYKAKDISVDNKPAEIEIEPELIEMSFGIYENYDTTKMDPKFLQLCFDMPDQYIPPEGGEDYDHVVERAGKVVEKMRKRIVAGEFTEDDIVMLVSHGALNHGMFEYLKKAPRSQYWDVDFNNCAIAELFIGPDPSKDNYKFISEGFEKNWQKE